MKIFKHKLTGRLGILFVLFTASFCYADRVCLEKATGKLIEYQSGDVNDLMANGEEPSAVIKQNRLDSLGNNAINVGYTADEIEVKEVTRAEWQEIEETQIKAPAREKAEQEAAKKKQKEAALKTKFGWTDEDLSALKEIFKQ